MINQDQVGYILQDLKKRDPRLWQAITSLKATPPPMPFYMEVGLPGVQVAATDVLGLPCILHLPIDPYEAWKISSVIIQNVHVSCKTVPTTKDYIADILITRNKRQSYVSIFSSDSKKAIIRMNDSYATDIDEKAIGTKEFFEGDEFRVDVLQVDGVVADCSITLKGYSNLSKLKKQE